MVSWGQVWSLIVSTPDICRLPYCDPYPEANIRVSIFFPVLTKDIEKKKIRQFESMSCVTGRQE